MIHILFIEKGSLTFEEFCNVVKTLSNNGEESDEEEEDEEEQEEEDDDDILQ